MNDPQSTVPDAQVKQGHNFGHWFNLSANVLVVVFLTGFAFREDGGIRSWWADSRSAAEQQRLVEEHWESLSLNINAIAGPQSPIDIVEFGDYECPYCRSVHPVLDSLGQLGVSIGYRHLPLDYHSEARNAAKASICMESVDEFAAVHRNILLGDHVEAGVQWWLPFAEAHGVSATVMNECMESNVTEARLVQDLEMAAQLGVTGTPTFIIGGSGIHSGTITISQALERLNK